MQKLLITSFLIFSSFAAHADGFYGGILMGQTAIDTGVSAVSGATLDEDGTGTSFFIGKEVNDQFSIEGFYTDLGEASLSGDSGDTFVIDATTYQFTATAKLAVEAETIGIAGKMVFDMGQNLRGYFKGGLHSWESEVKLSTGTASASLLTDGTDIIWGIGSEYIVNEDVSLLVGYDDYTLDDESVSFLHAGILLKF